MKVKVNELLDDGEWVVFKEGENLIYDRYVVVPNGVFKLTNINNASTAGQASDYVTFTDVISYSVHATTWYKEGKGTINFEGMSYTVTLYGNSQNESEDYQVTLDYPQTAGTEKMDFSGCDWDVEPEEPEPVCTETDDGNDPALVGTTTGPMGSPTVTIKNYTDKCFNSYSASLPSCEAGDNCYSTEYYCKNGFVTYEISKCDYGCENAVCLSGSGGVTYQGVLEMLGSCKMIFTGNSANNGHVNCENYLSGSKCIFGQAFTNNYISGYTAQDGTYLNDDFFVSEGMLNCDESADDRVADILSNPYFKSAYKGSGLDTESAWFCCTAP